MKKILILLVIFFSFGCTETNMFEAKAKYVCKDSGGLYSYDLVFGYKVVCKNGKVFSGKEVEKIIITDPKYFAKSPITIS